MIETSFINPFSFEAKEIVRKLGQIENLDKKNDSLIDFKLNSYVKYKNFFLR